MKPLTRKQSALMKVIMAGNIDAKGNRISWCDYTQILDRLPYTTTRESLMCSIRILREQNWIKAAGKEIRDGRAKQTIEPTAVALRILAPEPEVKIRGAKITEIIFDDIVELVME